MTITRKYDQGTLLITLTPEELIQAYREQDRLFLKEEIRFFWDSINDELEDSLLEENMDSLMEAILFKELSDVSRNYAIETVVDDFYEEMTSRESEEV